MADMGCKEELNAQVQALSSRVKSLELSNAGLTSLVNILTGVVNNILSLPVIGGLLPDVLGIFLAGASGFEAVLASSIPSLPSFGSVPALPTLDYQAVFGKIGALNLPSPAFPGDLSASITTGLTANLAVVQGQVTDAQAAIDAAVAGGSPPDVIAGLQAQKDALVAKAATHQDALDSAAGFFSSSNRCATCQTKSMKVTTG